MKLQVEPEPNTSREMNANKDRFSIAWWNTRMSPVKGKPLLGAERSLAIETIKGLHTSGIDIVCLGEVSSDDVNDISAAVGNGHSAVSLVESDLGKDYNLALILQSHVTLHTSVFLTGISSGHTYKIGSWSAVNIHDLSFDLFVVHWPSRLHVPENTYPRSFFGERLREEIDRRMADGRQHIIVAGDFNDEPFNHSMNEPLLATRDPAMARAKPKYLYNPFWKRMSPSAGHVIKSDSPEAFGTFYYSGHPLTKWRTLDQILVSSSFLGGNEWHLDEKNTDVWREGQLHHHVAKRKNLMDHLPVVGTFVRQ